MQFIDFSQNVLLAPMKRRFQQKVDGKNDRETSFDNAIMAAGLTRRLRHQVSPISMDSV